MLKKSALIVLFFILAPIFLTLIYVGLHGAALWCFVWLCLWAWFVNSKQDIFNRGLFFTVFSVLVAFAGRAILKDKEHADILEMLSQTFLIIGGGVGGNFMAQYVLAKKP